MKRINKPININTRLLLIVGTILIAAGLVQVLLVNYTLRQDALAEAEAKARIILDRNLATHEYFSKQLKPNLFKLIHPLVSKEYFEPTWMSSTYAVREIEKQFSSLNEAEYYYQECAINARSPQNEADEFERTFIIKLNTDPSLSYQSSVRSIEGKPYYTVLRRGEVMEAACLRCHSTPENAPADLVKIYGPERSFNRSVGETVSAISIRVPIAIPYRKAKSLTIQLSVIFLLVLLILLATQYGFNKRYVLSPVKEIRDKANQISNDEMRLGEKISPSESEDFNELIRSFNLMSDQLRQGRELLVDRVKERTKQLSIANESLRVEVGHHNRTGAALKKSEKRLTTFMNSATEAFLLWDEELNLKMTNAAGIGILFPGEKQAQLIGKPFLTLLPKFKDSGTYEQILDVKNTGISALVDDKITHPGSGPSYLDIRAFKVNDGLGMSVANVTDRRQAEEKIKSSLKEKETLLQEIHHRVKNNMQVISSLLKLQSNAIDDKRLAEAFTESQNRVFSMSAVHEILYGSENLAEINLETYLSKILETLLHAYQINTEIVQIEIESDEVFLDINNASPLGLIINELASNAFKYAFPGNRKGKFSVRAKKINNNKLSLIIRDDGVGVSENFDWRSSKTLGIQLVHTLVENQLNGQIEIENKNGTAYFISFNI